MKTILGMHMYQFIVVSLSTTMIFFGLKKFFSGQQGQSLLKLVMRILIWGSMAAVALFPGLTNQLANIIGLEGNINAVILTGFLLVFLIIFKILSIVEQIEQNISELTRQQALDKSPKTKQETRD